MNDPDNLFSLEKLAAAALTEIVGIDALERCETAEELSLVLARKLQEPMGQGMTMNEFANVQDAAGVLMDCIEEMTEDLRAERRNLKLADAITRIKFSNSNLPPSGSGAQ